jgi:hypothetical protein
VDLLGVLPEVFGTRNFGFLGRVFEKKEFISLKKTKHDVNIGCLIKNGLPINFTEKGWVFGTRNFGFLGRGFDFYHSSNFVFEIFSDF